MGELRLNDLAQMTINRDVDIPIELVIDELYRKKRRLNFLTKA